MSRFLPCPDGLCSADQGSRGCFQVFKGEVWLIPTEGRCCTVGRNGWEGGHVVRIFDLP